MRDQRPVALLAGSAPEGPAPEAIGSGRHLAPATGDVSGQDRTIRPAARQLHCQAHPVARGRLDRRDLKERGERIHRHPDKGSGHRRDGERGGVPLPGHDRFAALATRPPPDAPRSSLTFDPGHGALDDQHVGAPRGPHDLGCADLAQRFHRAPAGPIQTGVAADRQIGHVAQGPEQKPAVPVARACHHDDPRRRCHPHQELPGIVPGLSVAGSDDRHGEQEVPREPGTRQREPQHGRAVGPHPNGAPGQQPLVEPDFYPRAVPRRPEAQHLGLDPDRVARGDAGRTDDPSYGQIGHRVAGEHTHPGTGEVVRSQIHRIGDLAIAHHDDPATGSQRGPQGRGEIGSAQRGQGIANRPLIPEEPDLAPESGGIERGRPLAARCSHAQTAVEQDQGPGRRTGSTGTGEVKQEQAECGAGDPAGQGGRPGPGADALEFPISEPREKARKGDDEGDAHGGPNASSPSATVNLPS